MKIIYKLGGFIGFIFIITYTTCISILLYNYIKYLPNYLIAVIMMINIIINTFICILIDYFRRKIMINRPLNEILKATKQMAKGNFNIHLITKHQYGNYDEFDLIKLDLICLSNELSKNEIFKNDFIANISHEIKTPLSIISTYVQTLKNGNLNDEEKQEYLDSLKETCTRLNNLVNNVLKLNKLENNKLQLDITRFNISDLLATQIIEYATLIEQKKINLECEIEDDLYINSEKSYLEIVFNNLISNAIKFTNIEGDIYISLHYVNKSYIITVKDTGCGMDEETGKHIFDKFYQGETSHTKEGNGLGLALVKKVIDLIGGVIEVNSEVGRGTSFTVVVRSEEYE